MLQIPLTMLPLGVCKKTGTHPNRPELVVLKGTGPVPGSHWEPVDTGPIPYSMGGSVHPPTWTKLVIL